MKTTESINTGSVNIQSLTHELCQRFSSRAELYDQDGSFVAQNYQDLKHRGMFGALIPKELGGLGVSYKEMCEVLSAIGGSCGSTALCLSMHTHLIAANIWKLRQGKPLAESLNKIAQNQTILISTGAKDWLSSNGQMKKVEGGYLLSGVKHFASQSAQGDILITSARYEQGPEASVLHFPIPMNSKGVTVLNNWDTLGMRGTGSHSVKLDEVFVAEEAVVLSRPADAYHPVYNVVLTVAMPLIMSVYLGIGRKAFKIALDFTKKLKSPKEYTISTLAAINNLLLQAELNWKSMIEITNEFDFEPTNENGHQILTRKTNMTQALSQVVSKSVELVGGSAYFKSHPLERLSRDIQAAKYHPLPEAEQLLFSGKHLLENMD